MILCTVTNNKYALSVINLIESYKINSFNHEILLYHFDLSEEVLDFIDSRYGSQVICSEIKEECDYAHEPLTFFYKTYAINKAKDFGGDFIYSDATNTFIQMTVDLRRDLSKHSRIFLQYPYEKLKNKYWTTKKCFEEMGCNTSNYHEAPQYWAGFQVYQKTSENDEFISDMYKNMLNVDIAKPDVTSKRPDGESALCVEHRQDQSVFSLLIEKYGFQQEYNHEMTNKYGDLQTMLSFDRNTDFDFRQVVLYSRASKFGDFKYLSEDIIEAIK